MGWSKSVAVFILGIWEDLVYFWGFSRTSTYALWKAFWWDASQPVMTNALFLTACSGECSKGCNHGSSLPSSPTTRCISSGGCEYHPRCLSPGSFSFPSTFWEKLSSLKSWISRLKSFFPTAIRQLNRSLISFLEVVPCILTINSTSFGYSIITPIFFWPASNCTANFVPFCFFAFILLFIAVSIVITYTMYSMRFTWTRISLHSGVYDSGLIQISSTPPWFQGEQT